MSDRSRRKRSHRDGDRRDRKRVKKEPQWHGDKDNKSLGSGNYVKKEEKLKIKHENKIYPEMQKRADKWYKKAEEGEEGSDSEDSSVEQPDFQPSGALKKDTAFQKNGKDLKYLPPAEAAKPTQKWRMHVFSNGEQKRVLHLHRVDHFLFGRDKRVADIELRHISVSAQHAALQYRLIHKTTKLGEKYTKIVPYLIDLESTHGTFINKEKMVPRKFYELLSTDVIKFGKSSRSYVFILQDEVQIDYNEATVTNHQTQQKLQIAHKDEEKEFVDLKKDPPKKLNELPEDDLWDL